jgi:hypothetical protein
MRSKSKGSWLDSSLTKPQGQTVSLTSSSPNALMILALRLLHIYVAMLERGLQYRPWKVSTTVVLRKPGKPHYNIPKAYRPIALLNTMWKVLTAVVAEQVSYYTETFQLLPSHHFGGRPGRTTTDAMHLLTHKIKAAWHTGKIAAVLFLDVEGAFPNVVPEVLANNLRKRGIPEKFVHFVESMLEERYTVLKFDGFTSDRMRIDNGIGQGDPLSMLLYQFYNADLLDIPARVGEDALAYVDDTILVAIADTFEEAHVTLADMMTKEGGVAEWSRSHNSPLEYSKLALIDFVHGSSTKSRIPLALPQRQVLPAAHTKYLGIHFDQNLNWKEQHVRALAKGTAWASQIRRLTSRDAHRTV